MNRTYYYILFVIANAAAIYYNGLNLQMAKNISMTFFALLAIMAFLQMTKLGCPKIFRKWIKWLIWGCIANFVLAYDKLSVEHLFNLEIVVPLLVAYSSYYLLDIKQEKLYLYLFPICLFAAFSAISSVLSGLGGFHIMEYYDAEIAKNQIGAAFTSIAIICAAFVLEAPKQPFKIGYGFLSVICLYPALCFTCRTAIISYVIVVAYLLFHYYGWKGVFVVPLVVGLIIVIGGNNLSDMLYDSMVGERDASDVDDLTSNRVSQAIISFNYFVNHPLLGFYGSGDDYSMMPPTAHIYLLYRLSKWGLIGAIPFIVLYFSIFKVFLNSLKTKNLLLAGVLLHAFIESFSEYAPPFGPGSCFTLNFVLIGYFLRNGIQNLSPQIKRQ